MRPISLTAYYATSVVAAFLLIPAASYGADPAFAQVPAAGTLEVVAGQSLTMTIEGDISSSSSANPAVCSVAPIGDTKRQVSVIGLTPGMTSVTFTVTDIAPITYTIRVTADEDLQRRRLELAQQLMASIAVEYPSARVQLVVVPTGKLIMKGTVPDHATSRSILTIVTGDLFPEPSIVNELQIPCVPCQHPCVPCQQACYPQVRRCR